MIRGKAIRRMLVLLVTATALFYLGLVLLVYLFQDRLVYFPLRKLEATPMAIGLAFEDVSIKTDDGITIHGWYIPADSARGTLLFCHGNGGNISHRLTSIRQFHDLRLSVMIFDYRGYGQSEGSPDEEGTYRDAEAVRRYLVDSKGVNPSRLIYFGRSLGGAVAAWLAVKHQPAALILESCFSSIEDVGAHAYWFLPVRLLSRYHYPASAYVQQIHVPLLVIHSPEDDIVPYKFGRRLFESANEPKEFLQISGSHNDGYISSSQQYLAAIDRFLGTSLSTE
jgi:fermentation-respiration switch protein FrsA (DUF1100 family)